MPHDTVSYDNGGTPRLMSVYIHAETRIYVNLNGLMGYGLMGYSDVLYN